MAVAARVVVEGKCCWFATDDGWRGRSDDDESGPDEGRKGMKLLRLKEIRRCARKRRRVIKRKQLLISFKKGGLGVVVV